jgi:hypothetical protein
MAAESSILAKSEWCLLSKESYRRSHLHLPTAATPRPFAEMRRHARVLRVLKPRNQPPGFCPPLPSPEVHGSKRARPSSTPRCLPCDHTPTHTHFPPASCGTRPCWRSRSLPPAGRGHRGQPPLPPPPAGGPRILRDAAPTLRIEHSACSAMHVHVLAQPVRLHSASPSQRYLGNILAIS